MKSARRQARIAKKNKATKKSINIFKFLIPALILVILILLIKLSTHVWNGKDKIAFAYQVESGDVGLTIVDPNLSEITTLFIPAETQVDVARNLGTIRIKNVWQLGQNEKIGGILLPETVTRNFTFPVFLWASENASGLAEGNLGQILRFVLIPGQTNISLGDRVAMCLFAAKIQEFGRTEINLGESQFLTKQKLNDGHLGYVSSGPISQRLTVYFSDNQILEQNIKINITDATGKSGVAEKMGEIIEVLGGKVVSIDKKVQAEDTDCTIGGTNQQIVNKISRLFSCQKTSKKSSFDIDISLGQKFAKRF